MPAFSYTNPSATKHVIYCAPDGQRYDVGPNETVSGTYGTSILTTTQTGTTYTLQLTDIGSRVSLNNASAITLTIPVLSAAIGDQVIIEQTGAGLVTLVGSDVTINSQSGSLALKGQWAVVTLIYDGSNNWTLIGNLA